MYICSRTAAAAIREFERILDELYPKPPKWEMLTLPRDEVENMREIIKYQDKKLRDITERFVCKCYNRETLIRTLKPKSLSGNKVLLI